ncbi:CHSTA-like protein [Mya arenaria]|uniref:Carbohydrate sulfotransferase n=1 Tax=Mya arenaria TaxID=6604 RepID=A0ABY7G8X0_MYAAR|nr:uncharacterized protein LOC128222960 [Mya arenaria]WAR30865.1 CHSTA-like protein [Mya arenaria]
MSRLWTKLPRRDVRNSVLAVFITSGLIFLSYITISKDNVQSSRFPLKHEESFATSPPMPFKEQRHESMYDRVTRVANICRKPDTKYYFKTAPITDSRHFLYNITGVCSCTVPKAASTSMKRLLLMAEFPEKADTFWNMPGNLLHAYKRDTESCTDNPGFSFFVTRNPYERLYSAYIDKIFLEKFEDVAVLLDAVYVKKVYSHLITRTTSALLAYTRAHGYYCQVANASFEHFLNFVANAKHIDPHYSPVSLLCNPCAHPVNYIFKQENLERESETLVDYLRETLQSNATFKDMELHLPNYIGNSGISHHIQTYHDVWKMRLMRNHCKLNTVSYREIWERLWQSLKISGNINETLEFKPKLFQGKGIILKSPERIIKDFKFVEELPVLSKEARARQRRKFLVEAYSKVSASTLKKIQKLFRLDFEMFGYDLQPPI